MSRAYHVHSVIGAVYQGQKPPGKQRFETAAWNINPLIRLSTEVELVSASRTPQLALLHLRAGTSHHDAKDAAFELLEHLCVEAEDGHNALRCTYALVHWDGEDECQEIGGGATDAAGAMPL